MSDFVTLKCPSCGGQLRMTRSTLSYRCPSCGNEHILRHKDSAHLLESHAQCLKCHRNDRVVKVSGLVESDTNHAEGVTLEKRDYQDNDGHWYTQTERVPFTGTQASLLAQKLAPPTEPKEPSEPGYFLYIILVILLALFSLFWFNASRNTAIYLLFVPVFFGVGLYLKYKSDHQAFEANIKVYNEYMLEYEEKYSRWQLLYYCRRCDIIFVPDDSTWYEPDQMEQYLDNTPTPSTRQPIRWRCSGRN